MDDRSNDQKPGEQRPDEKQPPAWLEDLAHEELAAATLARLTAATEAGEDAEYAHDVTAARALDAPGRIRLRVLQADAIATASAGAVLYTTATALHFLLGRAVRPLEERLEDVDTRCARLEEELTTAGAVAFRDRLTARLVLVCGAVDRALYPFGPPVPVPAQRTAHTAGAWTVPAQRATDEGSDR
ncbi:hypothetical protein R6L23_22470 [Streptomyces sp. SR27]|uniref:hypothetical protein n=1 Tax=Streptomyces sp. SR27 TaxID=3076630 RepID=UPI00295B3814|nr:hypothetical protein [Streptomyces sp. SR27]MDV9190942.1 hypothetical protein [Streptomyces sp. SR27]